MTKSLFTPKELADVVLLSYKLQTDKDIEHFETKLEKIFLDKLFATAEIERLLSIHK